MAYYTKLINAWNGVIQPPTGVVGTGLTVGMTTQQKIDAVNGWTITGAIPSSMTFSGVQLLNCISWSEFNTLTAEQQQNIFLLCVSGLGGGLLGGSANTSLLPVGLLTSCFPPTSVTITNLTALSKGFTQPWWQAKSGGELNGPVSMSDTIAAGLT